MRIADPGWLMSMALPAFAASLNEAELARLIPLPLKDIDDPDATPEPALGALIQLETSELAVVYFGKVSHVLTVEFPASADLASSVRNFLLEVPIPRSRITWHRPDVSLDTEMHDAASRHVG